MEVKKSYSDEIKDKINYQKKVLISFPYKVFEKLDKFAKDECNDCYWLVFEKLFTDYEKNKLKDPSTIMLMSRDEDLRNMIISLDSRLGELETPKEQIKKTKKRFGGNEK